MVNLSIHNPKIFAHLKPLLLLLSGKKKIKRKENHTLIFKKVSDHRSTRQYIRIVFTFHRNHCLISSLQMYKEVKASCEPELQNHTSTNAFNFKVQLFSTNVLAVSLNLLACVCCRFPSASRNQAWLEKVLSKSYTTNQGLEQGGFRDNIFFNKLQY